MKSWPPNIVKRPTVSQKAFTSGACTKFVMYVPKDALFYKTVHGEYLDLGQGVNKF